MTQEDYDRIRPVIEMAQRLHGSLHAKLIEKGVAPIDALIASLYATHGLATAMQGPVAATDWMRDALDEIERQQLVQVVN